VLNQPVLEIMAEMAAEGHLVVFVLPQVWEVVVLVDIVELTVVTPAMVAAEAEVHMVAEAEAEPVMLDLVEAGDQARCVLFGLAQQDNSPVPA
jgi:hypothetical protein